jgi:nitrite reductase (NADH) small subunit
MENTFLCKVEKVPQMRPLKVMKDGRGILVCEEAGKIYAFDEACPHKGLSMEHGVVLQGMLVCPWHQYKFDLETGRCRRRRCAPATPIEVEIKEDEVHLAQ